MVSRRWYNDRIEAAYLSAVKEKESSQKTPERGCEKAADWTSAHRKETHKAQCKSPES